MINTWLEHSMPLQNIFKTNCSRAVDVSVNVPSIYKS